MGDNAVSVSCNECQFDGTETCKDCVVSYLLGRGPDDAIIFDSSTARAVRLLTGAGLVPELRHQQRIS